jgi:RNA polymerase sigma-70 factor, ECF subfamily
MKFTESLSDEILVSHVSSGNSAALESLYDRHARILYAVAVRITGDAGSAEEVTQDAFFQLWRKSAQFDPSRGSVINSAGNHTTSCDFPRPRATGQAR